MALLTPAQVGTAGTADASVGDVASPTTLVPPIPTGHAVGDTLLLFTGCRSPVPTVATPSGWTPLLNVTGTYGRLALFARAVTGSETAPNVVWSSLILGASGSPIQARIAAFTNLDNSVMASMVDVLGSTTDSTSGTQSAGGSAVTSLADNDLVLSLTTRQETAFGTFTAPIGMANVTAPFTTTSGADMLMGWAYQAKTIAGAVGGNTFGLTVASPVGSSGVVVALKAKPAVVASYSELVQLATGLVSYWRLGEPSGSVVDSKGSNAGSAAGGVTRNVAGLIQGDANGAVRGDGTVGAYITVPYNSSLNSPQVSYECWVKIESFTSGRVILRRGSSVLSMTTTNAFRWAIQDSAPNNISQVSSNNVLNVGQRQHVVVTFGGGSAGMKIYVDGVSVGGAPSFTPAAGLISDTGSVFNMLALDVATAGMQGTLDEVAIYNRELSPAEVLDHYNYGRGPVDNPTGSLALSGSVVETSNAPPKYFDAVAGSIRLAGITAEMGVQPYTWGAPVRELPPLRHHMDAIAPNGRHYRWADDEPAAQNVLGNLRWSSTMPGGHESCDCVLARMPGVDYADLERLSTLRIIRSGGSVVGEFRLERTPQTSGDQMAISPSAVGWQAAMDDNKGVSITFIDRELGPWVGPNSQRRLAQLQAGVDPVDASSTQGEDGLPSLKLNLQGAWSRRTDCEAYYFMPSGDYAGRVKFDFQVAASLTLSDPNWVADLFTSVANGYSGFTQLLSDWMTSTSGSVDASATSVALANRRALMLRLYFAVASGADNTQYDVFLRNLRVFGNHGLQIRGTTAGKEGLLASDMIAYALRRWAPMLKVADPPAIPPAGQPYQPPNTDWIQPSDFVIPQAKFVDTTVGEMTRQLTRFELLDWAVWNDKIFYLSQRNGNPLARRWRARIGPAKFEETGKQVDRLWESIIVQFTDVDGTDRTVGPPGSGADVETADLKDSDPDNPANKLGMIRRDKLVMGTGTAEGAIEIGRRFLAEQKLIDRSGRATLVGFVEDNHGVLWPYSEVNAGDIITFVDAADTSYRRIVKADHDEMARAVSIDMDAPPEGLQAVLERLGVVLVTLGL